MIKSPSQVIFYDYLLFSNEFILSPHVRVQLGKQNLFKQSSSSVSAYNLTWYANPRGPNKDRISPLYNSRSTPTAMSRCLPFRCTACPYLLTPSSSISRGIFILRNTRTEPELLLVKLIEQRSLEMNESWIQVVLFLPNLISFVTLIVFRGAL